MKIKEMRQIDMATLRSLCVENDYYTCGDNDDYSTMLNMVVDKKTHKPKKLTTDLVLKIALDITEHSDVERIIDECCFTGYNEVVTWIAHEIIKASDTIVVEVA